MRQHWYSPKSAEETRIMDSYTLYGRKLSYAYTGKSFRSIYVTIYTYCNSMYGDCITKNIFYSYRIFFMCHHGVSFYSGKIINYKKTQKWMLSEIGIILSHVSVFIFTTLLMKLLYVGSIEDDPSNNTHNTQIGLSYHVNYMVDVETYYVPIFIHTAVCTVLYVNLILTFDVLYMILVQHCCGLFAALR